MDDTRWAIARQIPHLRRFALALSRDRDQADDLVQDCLERALRKHRLWGRRGSLRSWLFSVLYRTHIDGMRRRQRHEIPVEPSFINSAEACPPSQEHYIDCLNIGEALDRLPEGQSSAILLIALEGFTYDEAAEILDVPIGTVRSRLSRGREALRDALKATTEGNTQPRFLRRVK